MGEGRWDCFAPCVLAFTHQARRQLRRLAPRTQAAIQRCLKALQNGAPNLDIRRLAADSSVWRQRSGDWRILFEADFAARRILVREIVQRGDAYR